jgi:predicted small secreted protein
LIWISSKSNTAAIKRNGGELSVNRGIAIMLFNIALLSGAIVVLNACNTTAGIGQDVSAAGHAVTNTADKVKSGM